MNLKKTKKGFTLIELIVVVVVLAVLAAVAIPMISSWVAKAEANEVEANGRTVELAIKAFMAEQAQTDATEDFEFNGETKAVWEHAVDQFGFIGNEVPGSKGVYAVSADGSVAGTYPNDENTSGYADGAIHD